VPAGGVQQLSAGPIVSADRQVKGETRNPKAETRMKPEGRNPKKPINGAGAGAFRELRPGPSCPLPPSDRAPPVQPRHCQPPLSLLTACKQRASPVQTACCSLGFRMVFAWSSLGLAGFLPPPHLPSPTMHPALPAPQRRCRGRAEGVAGISSRTATPHPNCAKRLECAELAPAFGARHRPRAPASRAHSTRFARHVTFTYQAAHRPRAARHRSFAALR
jgi:hypothetical protein